LRANAGNLGEQEVVTLCDEALRSLPKGAGKGSAVSAKNAKTRRLIARGKAFEARGVYLNDVRGSWGGVRSSDGMVVMSLWADAVQVARRARATICCGRRTWTGARPWSDTPSGQERLKHCQLASRAPAPKGCSCFGERLERSPARGKGAQRARRRPRDGAALQGREAGRRILGSLGKEDLGETMAPPMLERKQYKIGKYDIVAQPANGSMHMLR